MRKILLSIVLFCFANALLAQVTATQCNQAVNICSNASFGINPNGNGTLPPSGSFGNPSNATFPMTGVGGSGCLLAGALNSTWMIINVQTTGTLEFSFGAGPVNPQAGCYDWIMYPFTTNTCAQITGNLVAPVRCNWNSTCSGGTGIANIPPVGSNAADFPPGLAVTCGQKFIICFSNYSSVTTNVSLNFFGSAQVSCNPIPNPLTLGNQTICQGNSVNLTVTGSAGNTYTWQPGNLNGNTISVSPTVTTTYSVAGSGGCGSVTGNTTAVVTVNQSNANFTIANSGPGGAGDPTPAQQCLNGNSFNFTSALAGGTHQWNFGPAATPATSSAANPTNVTFNTPGIYTISHTVTNAPCVQVITQTVQISPMPLATVTNSNPICGNTNGVIQISNTSPAGQTVVGFSVNSVAIPSQTVTGLGPGSYVISMVNNFGCTFSLTTNLANIPGITNMALTSVGAPCTGNTGIINVGVITGGTPAYQYNLNGGPFQGGTSFTGLAPGTYTVSVIDINNCPFTKTITVTGSTPPTNITFTTLPTACVGNTGVLGITGVTGGTAAYTFSVNGVGSGSVTNNLAFGPQVVMVKDVNGCTFSLTANIPIVSGPTAANLSITPAACGNANGSATVTLVTGGAPAYQYSFNGGPFVGSAIQGGMLAGPKNVVIKDINGCTLTVNFNVGNTGSPSSAIVTLTNVSCFGGSNGGFSLTTSGGTPGYSYTLTPGNITNGFGVFNTLAAGNYTINVKDILGCVTTVTTTIGQPSALTLTLSSLQPSCNGGNNGTVTATAAGGTSPYLYNINGGPNQAGNNFSTNISAGAYNVTVIDNLGCTLSQTIAVTQPSPITATLSTIAANCSSSNGSASVTASGGTPIYTYTWSPLGGNGSQTSGLTAATYTVLIKDTKNCTLTAVATISAIPGGTAVITNTSNITCFGAANGSLTANMVGNVTAPLSYSWSTTSTNQTAGPLGPGNYTVTVTDFYGCKSTTVGTVTQPSSITVTPGGSAALCFGQASGSASVIASGGTPGYTYLWSPNGATTTVTSGLAAGVYSIQVTDLNNCVQTRTITITQPTSVTINTSTLTAACSQSNGVASATATGGTPAYTYTWSTGFIGQTINNVFAGTYTVQVKDGNGCLYVLAATVPNASGPAIGVNSFTNPSCFGGNNGIATTTISGGTPGPGFPIYNWSNGQNTGTATNLLNGVYTVTLTDAAGCKASASVTITHPASLTINVSGTNPKCFNATNGTANAGVSGGTPGYTYAWLPAPGAGGSSATP
ncbi:MAG: SprB repeat-containing protein, partial [Bacteroidetes bacterium]|nr:SprB repeat-containing protein [Bacteroidota bacterium]